MKKTSVLSVISSIVLCCGLVGFFQSNPSANAGQLQNVSSLLADNTSWFGRKAAQPPLQQLPEKVLDRVQESVVVVHGHDVDHKQLGPVKNPGLIVGTDGFILINYKAIKDADELTVDLSNEKNVPAYVVGVDEKTSLSLIQVDRTGLPTLRFADSRQLESTTPLFILEPSDDGLTSLRSQVLPETPRPMQIAKVGPKASLIRIETGLSPYKSGTLLTNAAGELVGIAEPAEDQSLYSEYGYAMPTDLLEKVIGDLRDYGKVRWDNSTPVSRERKESLRQLGAELASLDADEASRLGLDGGLRVEKLYPGKLRKYTHIQEGFIITQVDGIQVSHTDQLSDALLDKKGGVMIEGQFAGTDESLIYAIKM